MNVEKIVLPSISDIQTIEMELFDEGASLDFAVIDDKEKIGTVVSALNGARKTMKSTINDFPVELKLRLI